MTHTHLYWGRDHNICILGCSYSIWLNQAPSPSRSNFTVRDSAGLNICMKRKGLQKITTTERLTCPGWETLVVPISQPGMPSQNKRGSFCPGSGNRDKRCCQRHVAGAPFCPGWCYQPGQKVLFFPVFLFLIFFLFQLYFCISIKLMYWNSVCMISTNIYIYI